MPGNCSFGNVMFKPGPGLTGIGIRQGKLKCYWMGQHCNGKKERLPYYYEGVVLITPANTELWHGAAAEMFSTHIELNQLNDVELKWLPAVHNVNYMHQPNNMF